MINKEAIQILENMLLDETLLFSRRLAIKKAIESLKESSKAKQKYENFINNMVGNEQDEVSGLAKRVRIIDTLHPLFHKVSTVEEIKRHKGQMAIKLKDISGYFNKSQLRILDEDNSW